MTSLLDEDRHMTTGVIASSLDKKVRDTFANLAIDKRRLPMSQLQKRGIPAYVAEWVLDTLVPGDGPLSEAEAEKVLAWATRFIPGPEQTNMIKNRLLVGEIVKVLTLVQVEVVLTRKLRERVAKLQMLGIVDAHIPDTFVNTYPPLLNQGM